MSKKQLLLKTYEEFDIWVREQGSLESNLRVLSEQLRNFLDTWVLVDPEQARQFVYAIPKALGQCDNREALKDPLFPAVYAYLHMLERYRRTWYVLNLLFQVGSLPIGFAPLQMVDVGMGPGPNSYAIQDFYKEVNEFATAAGKTEICTNDVQPFIIERSRNMCHFTHLFSEYAHRPGPFGANQTEFSNFFPSQMSSQNWRYFVDQTMEDLDTSERFAEWWLRDSGYQRGVELDFRLVVISYFFTPDNLPDCYRLEVDDLFKWIRPGAVIVVFGGAGSQYKQVLDQVQAIADTNRLLTLERVSSNIDVSYTDEAAQVIKQFYLQVAQILKCRTSIDLESIEGLPKELWDSDTPLSGPKSYAVRAFRKGRF